MARKQVHLEDVYRIADQLKGEGLNPSSTRVYQRLQCGSLSTITKYLRMWKDAEAREAEQDAIEVPQLLERQATRLFRALWTTASARSANELEDERRQVALQASQAQADIDEAMALADQAYAERDSAAQERDEALAGQRQLQDTVAELRTQLEVMTQARDEKAATLAESEAANQARETQVAELEKYQATLTYQRDNAIATGQRREERIQALEGELSASQQEQARLQQQLNDVKEHGNTLTVRLEAVASELREADTARQALTARVAELQHRSDADQAALADTRRQLDRTHQRQAKLEADLESRTEQLTACRDAYDRAQADLRSTERTASELNGRTLAMKDQIRHLNRELGHCQRQLIEQSGHEPPAALDDPLDDPADD